MKISWSLVLSASLFACSADDTAGKGDAGTGTTHGGVTGSGKDSGDGFGNSSADASANSVGSGALAGNGAGAGTSGSETCANTDVQATRVTPTVMLIVDQSGSMTTTFEGTTSRWDALRSFLLSADGLIHDLQGQVRFGLAMYSATSGAGTPPIPVGECPTVTTVAPKLQNFSAIAKTYNAAIPLDDTPTGDAIDKIVSDLDLTKLDTDADPVVFILATDGEPDTCEQLDPQDGQQESIDAVKNAFKLGIRTFIISVGDEVSAQHQQDVANAGIGHKSGEPDAMYWQAGDDKTLREAITEIIGKQLSCDIALKGAVEGGNACDGVVTLNGDPLACNGKDGWKLVDPKHIKLQGKACSDLKTLTGAMLHVTFPCGVAVVF